MADLHSRSTQLNRGGQTMAVGTGTKEDPWVLKTPPGTSSTRCGAMKVPIRPRSCARWFHSAALPLELHRGPSRHAQGSATGPLGAADEGKDAAPGTVEAWGRAADNPVGGWYGLRRATAAGSGCTSLRCSRRWAWLNLRTMPATTRCGRSRRTAASPSRTPGHPRPRLTGEGQQLLVDVALVANLEEAPVVSPKVLDFDEPR